MCLGENKVGRRDRADPQHQTRNITEGVFNPLPPPTTHPNPSWVQANRYPRLSGHFTGLFEAKFKLKRNIECHPVLRVLCCPRVTSSFSSLEIIPRHKKGNKKCFILEKMLISIMKTFLFVCLFFNINKYSQPITIYRDINTAENPLITANHLLSAGCRKVNS